jgi:hypothetical protein
MKNPGVFSSLVVASFLVTAHSAFASPVSELKNYFDQNISNFERKLSSLELGNSSTNPLFPLADINVQVSANASFGINSVLAISISPEIDFMVTPAVTP